MLIIHIIFEDACKLQKFLMGEIAKYDTGEYLQAALKEKQGDPIFKISEMLTNSKKIFAYIYFFNIIQILKILNVHKLITGLKIHLKHSFANNVKTKYSSCIYSSFFL